MLCFKVFFLLGSLFTNALRFQSPPFLCPTSLPITTSLSTLYCLWDYSAVGKAALNLFWKPVVSSNIVSACVTVVAFILMRNLFLVKVQVNGAFCKMLVSKRGLCLLPLNG